MSRRKSFDPLYTRNEEKKEKESDDLLKNLACSYVSWKKRKKEKSETERRDTERRREIGGWKKPFCPKPGKSEQEEERRELWGYFIVKMKAPPLVAAPLVRERRNRPIDSRIYRRGSMIQPGLPTTTLATADDSWCSWPESFLRIRRFSFRRLIASRYRCGTVRQDFADRYVPIVFQSSVESSMLTDSDLYILAQYRSIYCNIIIKYNHLIRKSFRK